MDHDTDIIISTPLLDEPSLPAAPPLPHPNQRKRPFLRSREPSAFKSQSAEVFATSSDPAFFSNDETPDAENYNGGTERRRKKTYQGTWWGEELRKKRANQDESTNKSPRKRRFQRNFDSGIFMADESSSADLSSDSLLGWELLKEQEEKAHATQDLNDKSHTGQTETSPSPTRRSSRFAIETALKRMPQGRPVHPKDHLIGKIVRECLDTNDESVDLMSMNLDSLPPCFTDLKSMIRRINLEPVHEVLAPFEAALKVYLGNNEFLDFPQPLLELSNIRLLSLRHNRLRELPPGIRSLSNLENLNVSYNRLQHLPYEVLELFVRENLQNLYVAGNPWLALPKPSNEVSHLPLTKLSCASKGVSLLQVAVGIPFELSPSGNTRPYKNVSNEYGKRPSLTEVVLRALQQHNTSKADLSSHLSEDHPEQVRKHLATLFKVQSSGGRRCTFCTRNMVLPRYSWYEWWTLSVSDPTEIARLGWNNVEDIGVYSHMAKGYDEEAVPFQRMACGCVDVATGLKRETEKFNLGEQWMHDWKCDILEE